MTFQISRYLTHISRFCESCDSGRLDCFSLIESEHQCIPSTHATISELSEVSAMYLINMVFYLGEASPKAFLHAHIRDHRPVAFKT